ncbi:MAG: LptF/LptG family permease [Campylobacterales bacterium]
MLNRYVAWVYLRYALLIMTALIFFFVGMDLINEADKLPDSANLVFLYVVFQAAYSLETVMPLSLVFGAIAAKIHLIRMNELVAAYSLGASRGGVMKPFLAVSLLFAFVYIAASTTSFAYSGERAKAIKKDRFLSSITQDLFLKYDDSFVYIRQLLPLQNEARGLEILEVEGGDLKRHLWSERASFRRNAWQMEAVTVISKPPVSGLQPEGLKVDYFPYYEALEGFRPEIMDTVYENKSAFSLVDAARAWLLFSGQKINTDRIRGVFYSSLVFPLFAPLFVVIMFFFVPISSRFFNVALFSSMAVLTTLVAWGLLFALSQLARNGTLQPELALLLPFGVVAAVAGYLLKSEL